MAAAATRPATISSIPLSPELSAMLIEAAQKLDPKIDVIWSKERLFELFHPIKSALEKSSANFPRNDRPVSEQRELAKIAYDFTKTLFKAYKNVCKVVENISVATMKDLEEFVWNLEDAAFFMSEYLAEKEKRRQVVDFWDDFDEEFDHQNSH